MHQYKAEYNAGDTGQSVRSFVKNHHNELVNLILKIAPYLTILYILSVAMTHFALQEAIEGAQQAVERAKASGQELDVSQLSQAYKTAPWLGTASIIFQLLMGYLFAVIAISWHRLILLGADKYQPMQVFKPQKHEIDFLVVLAMVSGVIPFAVSYLLTTPFALKTGLSLALFPFILVFIYGAYKVCFYFPAKAVNAPITFKQSFALTKGYFWKMMGAIFFASWRIILALVVAVFLFTGVFGSITAVFGSGTGFSQDGNGSVSSFLILQSLISLPIILYVQPLLTVLGVSVLSNYYQHALQNKSVPQS